MDPGATELTRMLDVAAFIARFDDILINAAFLKNRILDLQFSTKNRRDVHYASTSTL